jgi:hypothetical protein
MQAQWAAIFFRLIKNLPIQPILGAVIPTNQCAATMIRPDFRLNRMGPV